MSWNELTISWNEMTFLWNEITFLWNDLTMERNDRKPYDQSADYQKSFILEYCPPRNLRSTSRSLVSSETVTRKTDSYGGNAFSVAVMMELHIRGHKVSKDGGLF